MFSRFFIDRPRFAGVLMIVIMLAGLLAVLSMPIALFPPVTPPVIIVSATYPGASAEVVETTVAAPLEEAINGVEGMLDMSSISSNAGGMQLSITFTVGTDPEIAQVNVRNRVAIAEPRLPEEVRRQGLSIKKQSTEVLMYVPVSSSDPAVDSVFLANYADLNIREQILRLPGVSDVNIYGSERYSMRLWLDPDRMTGLGLTAIDIIEAVREQNVQVAAGRVGQTPNKADQQFTYTVNTKGRLRDVEEFENVIVRANPNGSVIQVKDVARVELGARNYNEIAKMNGQPVIILAIFPTPKANALETSDLIERELERLAQSFPPHMEYHTGFNTATFIKQALREVVITVAIAATMVIIVIFLFLGDWRATLIPMITIPVSLIGAFTVLMAFGFSINMVTLFGLLLAVGVVVDDAIVVIENTQRLVHEGMAPYDAAIKSMRQVTGPVIATTLVLLGVFVPIGFIPGITGGLYQQFAVAISAALVLSSLNALTLTPALCAVLLRERKPWAFLGAFDNGVKSAARLYDRGISWLVGKVTLVFLAFAVLCTCATIAYRSLPTAFLPDEDQGRLYAVAQLPEGAALPRTNAVLAEIREILLEIPGISFILEISGINIMERSFASNAGFAVVVAEEFDSGRPAVATIIANAQAKLGAIQQANVFAFGPATIRGLGRTGGWEFQLQDAGGRSPQELAAVLRGLIVNANERPELARVFSTFQADVPQIYLDVDRHKAKTLGVPLADVYTTLQAQLGGLHINDFNKFGRVYEVRIQADQRFRDSPDDIPRFYVRNDRGEVLPMGTLVNVKSIIGPETIKRYNMFRAAQISGMAAPGYSSGEALQAMEAVAKTSLPPGMRFEWSGLSRQEAGSTNQAPLLLALAALFVYLFLVAQYESWTLPVAVMLSVPVALLGATIALYAAGLANDTYAQIGMAMLVGLASKNAILIVEFAAQEHRRGSSIIDAAKAGAHLRFRAVIMTALSFLFGVLPLVLATGAGAASRHSLGIPVFGGMAAAAMIGTFLVPVFYVAVQTLAEKVSARVQPLLATHS